MNLRLAIATSLFLSVVAPAALAKWAYVSASVLVSTSDLIAVVDVGPPREELTRFKMSLYHKKATAKVEQIIKGPKVGTIDIVADITSENGARICVPDINLTAGRHLVLMRAVDRNYVSNNSNFGFELIEKDQVHWFANAKVETNLERVSKPLNVVIQEIKQLMQTK